jgi:VRR-NUC domain.
MTDEFSPSPKPRRTIKGTKIYKKSAAVKYLEDEYYKAWLKKYPKCPFPYKTRFTDNNANGLTKCVVEYIKLLGGSADRINNGAVYDPVRKTFRKGGTRRGIADIDAILRGRSLKIEVKFGKDRMSEYQKAYKADIERAGGVYLVAHTFEQIKGEIDEFIKYHERQD